MTLRISPHAIEQDQGPFIFPGVRVHGGNDFVVYSDEGVTEELRIDGVTGHIGMGVAPTAYTQISMIDSVPVSNQLRSIYASWTQTLPSAKGTSNTSIQLVMEVDSAGYNMTNDITGVLYQPTWTGIGTLNEMTGFRFQPTVTDVSGLVTDMYGFYVDSYAGSGEPTNYYGIYVENIVADSLAYSIYTNTGDVSFGDDLVFRQASSVTTTAGQLTIDAAGGIVFNDDQDDEDLRMESDAREYMFFLDASGNYIGIGNQPWGYWTPIAGHTTQLNISTPFAMATVTAPLIINNTSNSTNAYAGIMFSVEPGAYGKGYIGFKRDTGWGIGRLVFASDATGDGGNVWPATDVRFEFTYQSYLVFPQATEIQVTGTLKIDATGGVGIGKVPADGILDINLPTEDFAVVDAGSVAATEQDWVEVTVGSVTGYLHVFAAK